MFLWWGKQELQMKTHTNSRRTCRLQTEICSPSRESNQVPSWCKASVLSAEHHAPTAICWPSSSGMISHVRLVPDSSTYGCTEVAESKIKALNLINAPAFNCSHELWGVTRRRMIQIEAAKISFLPKSRTWVQLMLAMRQQQIAYFCKWDLYSWRKNSSDSLRVFMKGNKWTGLHLHSTFLVSTQSASQHKSAFAHSHTNSNTNGKVQTALLDTYTHTFTHQW